MIDEGRRTGHIPTQGGTGRRDTNRDQERPWMRRREGEAMEEEGGLEGSGGRKGRCGQHL